MTITDRIASARQLAIKTNMIETCHEMARLGLIVNTSGNVSVRTELDLIITPSGLAYDQLGIEDLAIVDIETGKPIVEGPLASSELPLHLAVYRTSDARAIIHTHPVYGTALSTIVNELPAIHYQIADLGGTVPVVPYQRFGSEALASSMSEALQNRPAVLMENHGATVTASDLGKALSRTITLEWLCQVYFLASSVRKPTVLAKDEVAQVLAKQLELRRRREKALEKSKTKAKFSSSESKSGFCMHCGRN